MKMFFNILTKLSQKTQKLDSPIIKRKQPTGASLAAVACPAAVATPAAVAAIR